MRLWIGLQGRTPRCLTQRNLQENDDGKEAGDRTLKMGSSRFIGFAGQQLERILNGVRCTRLFELRCDFPFARDLSSEFVTSVSNHFHGCDTLPLSSALNGDSIRPGR